VKLSSAPQHLAYCTNIHPAETWEETWNALKNHALKVRDNLITAGKLTDANGVQQPFAIGLRLSALAASELLKGEQLDKFEAWLREENCYVFTINGFPYGAFHGRPVKENVYNPDWTEGARLEYTKQMFQIIARLAPDECGGSVSTLPGSFKEFGADETEIFKNLYAIAEYIETFAAEYDKDLHLGLEPEPLGYFENTEETIAFFKRFCEWAPDPELVLERIGVNYDTCHFALEFDDCFDALTAFYEANIRISKIHLSNAIEISPTNERALLAIHSFNEPTYLHQVVINDRGVITRFRDIPDFLKAKESLIFSPSARARVHFHIPLYSEPPLPLGSTRSHAHDALRYLYNLPETCLHVEMETYTWGVLPNELQLPIEDQLTREYLWTLGILD